ncbi:uncharacterized protein SPSK_01756 [Sporothrix schenckii 1099-18]|uniref:Uncharacterized protein n=2 Tax=Sporothrix schenckii TaxID=29908 RepID=U7PLQ2_SPOS1|nr:uncharacterized protein SPSK_01756 [Sporothrix schenckii 1099-18]ERS96487.1 hypothetical protein HMPREF1624_07402 [Sporothrix schenckii ATCC 58251]KJR87228.1 hypothetical protein SPSK_01756 [Sporothrix schenckii 1099-18]
MLRSLWASRAPLASWLPRRPLTAGLSRAAASPAATPSTFYVRIKSGRRWRNAAIGAGVIYMCWSAYFTRVVLPPFADMIDDEDAQPIFFPLPFTFQVVESRPYKGTDPEWQTYIRIARDRELLLKIRNDMLETVRAAAEANPVLRHRCGHGMTVRKHWLDVDFPYRPPPKITRDGLMLTADGLDYVTAEVDSVTMMRISRALWPEPVALSATSFVTTLARQNMQNVARFFGFGEEPKTSPSSKFAIPPPEEMARLTEKLKRISDDINRDVSRAKRDGFGEGDKDRKGDKEDKDLKGNGQAAPGTTPGPLTSTGFDSHSPPLRRPQPAGRPEKRPANWDELSDLLRARDMIPFQSVRASIDASWRAFRQKLSETWLPLRPQPPGGSVGVSGLVELQSPTSRIMIAVSAYWDPKTRKYDTQTMHLKLRSIRPLHQMPL